MILRIIQGKMLSKKMMIETIVVVLYSLTYTQLKTSVFSYKNILSNML